MPSSSRVFAIGFAVAVLFFSAAQSQVRQCSCQEQAQCLEDMKGIGQSCVDQCWSITGKVTANPDKLRQCFKNGDDETGTFIDCFHDAMQGCAPDMNGPMIAPQSLDAIVTVAERKIRATIKSTLDSGLAGNVDRLIAATEEFSNCAKQCVEEKTAGGICMQKYNCQPLLPNEKKAKQLFSKCSRFDFKKHAGPLCQCALDAGVQDLSTYCPVLMLMAPQH